MGVDPITATLIVGTVLSAAGTAYSAYQQHEAASDQKKLEEKQARMEMEAAQGEASNIREKGKRLVAGQRAALAASGVKVDEGTGDALQQETKRLTEQDALAVLKEGSNRSSLLRGQARISGKRADAALIGGALDVGATAAKGRKAYLDTKTPEVNIPKAGTTTAAASFARRSAPKYSLLNPSSKYSVN